MRVMHECLNVLRGLLSQDVEPKLASKSCKARIATKRTRCQQEDEGREVSISLVESGSSEKPAKHFAALRGKGSTTTCTCFVNNIATSCPNRGHGATAARLTPDQKVGSSNLSALIFVASIPVLMVRL